MLHKKLIPLDIDVKRSVWRQANVTASDAEFQSARLRVLERDDYTCRGCNFRSPPARTKKGDGPSYMDVHHLDHDHGNNALDNLATMCPFCHQAFHIGYAGVSNGGILIWLPEISQADLNNLARTIFIALIAETDRKEIANNPNAATILDRAEDLASRDEALVDGRGFDKEAYIREQMKAIQPALPIAGSARAAYASLEARALYLEEVFAERASDPSFFGQAILDIDEKSINRDIIKNVRLLPRPDRFTEALNHWAKLAYKGLPVSAWPDLIKPQEIQEA